MRKFFLGTVSMLLAVLLLLSGCASQKNAQAPVQETPPQENAEQVSAAVGLPNPIVTVDSYEELLAAVPGVRLSDAPADATEVVYTYINMEPMISQIDFVYAGDTYTYRAAAAKEDEQIDISGVYEQFSEKRDIESAVTEGGFYTLLCNDESTDGLAQWYYPPTGCQYSLYTENGCDESQQIEDVVDLLMVVPGAAQEQEAVPAAKVAGEVQGKVISVTDNSIVVNMDNGSTLVFLMSYIHNAQTVPGDIVHIAYSGNLTEAPEAVSIEVLESAPHEKTVNGTVTQCDDAYMHISTETGNVYGFSLTDKTKYTGAAKKLKLGNIVTVSYLGDLENLPVAEKVNTVVEGKDAPDPLQNKKIKGTVRSVATKSMSIIADSGAKYTFPKDGKTRISGDYDLKKGATVQVTYDGYASKAPYAKEIKVLAPPDPTPPSPKPTLVPTQYFTVRGVVLAISGNMLSIQDGYNDRYSFLLRNSQVVGYGYPGANATVTYYYTDDLGNVVTKVVFDSPAPAPTTKPQPRPTTQPIVQKTISGIVVMQAGNALSVQTDSGTVYSFLLRAPEIRGRGGVGDRVTVTFDDYGTSTNVTYIWYQTPIYTAPPAPTFRPGPGPTTRPEPTYDPDLDPFLDLLLDSLIDPDPDPFPDPDPIFWPDPTPTPTPDPYYDPDPDLFFDPWDDD